MYVSPIANLYDQLGDWYASQAGQGSLTLIHEHLANLQSNLSGQRALYCGPEAVFNEASMKQGDWHHRFLMHPGLAQGQVRGRPDALPFAANTLDFMALAHPLELSEQPHGVLREADRVLVANGHLLLIEFNPWGWYGVWRLFSMGRFPWDRHFYGFKRVKDWLSVLNFEIQECRYAAFPPPFQNRFLQQSGRAFDPQACWRLNHLGGVYCLLARKLRIPITPIRERWYRSPMLIPKGLAEAEPTSRGINRETG